MNNKKVLCDGMGWIQLAEKRVHQRTLVNMVMNVLVPQNIQMTHSMQLER
jgi:hypothetical protein